jgi:ubiquinone/menaquinone biosynthesis C-methylase UbiE
VTVKVSHPVCSRLYSRQVDQAEKLGLAARREQLLTGVSGDVVEIGAGTGANLAHYPRTVTKVVALEPEPYLRERLSATVWSRTAPAVEVGDAVAEDLPYDDGTFEAAVACLVLCSVRDPRAALAELHRVIRPGGELRFMEHIGSPRPARRALQRGLDATVWPLLSGGCHLGRATDGSIEEAGFEIESCERFGFRIPPLDPPKTHILGVARRR